MPDACNCPEYGGQQHHNTGCPNGGWRGTSSVGALTTTEPSHRHRWVYDGQTTVGLLIYHCDAHDPPEVRQVWPGVTL
jgi:hypothetical protein